MVVHLIEYVTGKGAAYGLEAHTELIDVVAAIIDSDKNIGLSQLARQASAKIGPKYKRQKPHLGRATTKSEGHAQEECEQCK